MIKIKVNNDFNIHTLKPKELAIFKNGSTAHKNYWGLKPICKKMPKPFSISNFLLSLHEDEYGWYNISGELVLDIS